MQKLRISFFGVALLLGPGVASADLEVIFGLVKNHTQTSAAGPVFSGGDFSFNIRDGQILVTTTCPNNGSETSFPAAPLMGCPLGSTGIISYGDVDDDGLLDNFTYWEITSDVSASAIMPFRPELCKLSAAPASALPRPLGGFQDDGVVSFYNINTVAMKQYEMTRYEMTRSYASGNGEARRMAKEFVPGQYSFQFPWLGNPEVPVGIPVTLLPNMEAYDASSAQGKKGFRFLGNRWKGGYYEVDPRTVNTFTWQGNQVNVRPGNDFLFLNIETNASSFPPNGSPLYIPNVLTTSYSMPPGFFTVGETGTFTLSFQRTLGISAVAADASVRNFSFPIKFIDSYGGYSTYGGAFPVGSSAAAIKSTADFDKDGYANVTEFALQSDPNDAASTPFDPLVPVLDGPVSATNYERTDDGTTITITIQKRPNTGSSLTYFLETKETLASKKWAKIKTGNFSSKIHWKVVETATELVFTSDGTVPVNALIRPLATAAY